MPHPAFLSAIHISANHGKPPRTGAWQRYTDATGKPTSPWFYTATPEATTTVAFGEQRQFHPQPSHLAKGSTLAEALDDEIRF